jgi:putative ABC transport system permease protein
MNDASQPIGRATWFSDLAQDVRYATRILRKSPGFSAVAILTLALGIGANTAIFSVVNATLLKPLPFRNPEKIVALWQTESAPGSFPLSGADYLDWKSQNHTFEDMALFSWPSNSNVTAGSSPEGATVVQTEANFFSLLGVNPQIGRNFAAGEDQKGGSKVAILSHALWKSRFAASNDVLGKPISLNGEAYTLIGVMPAWYRTPGDAEVWVPLDMSRENLGERGNHSWKAIGRLKQGIVLEQARFDLKTIAASYEKQFPATNRGVSAIVTPMREDLIGDFSTQILILFGAVGLVLLIACANVANLLLARSTSRLREIGVRSALGAGRGRLVRQLLTESVLLSLIGGALGVAIAFAGVAALRAQLSDTIPEPNPVAVDFAPLFFTFLVCIAVGILFGLAPAVQSSSLDCGQALKSKGVAGAFVTRRSHWLRNFLVAGEIALSLALLAGAGLLLRTFVHLRSTDIGIRGENVLTATVRLPLKQYTNLDQGALFYDRLIEKLQAAPGVRSAAITTKLPLQGGTNGYIQVPGIQMERESGPLIEFSSVSQNYFLSMGIPLLQGREFIPDDFVVTANLIREAMTAKTSADAKVIASRYVLPAVINRTMAQTFWPKESPIGKIYFNWAQFRVVGVVGDVNQMRLRERVMPEAYNTLPWEFGVPTRPFSIVVQTTAAPKTMTNTLRSVVQSLDPNLALFRSRTMPEILSESMQDTSYEAALLGAMAVLALILASVGTYGVMSYVVGQRTNEIGIRMALGARPTEILSMIAREMFSVVGAGIVLGFVGALIGAKVMKDLLVGVAPFDPLTYAGVSLLLAVVAFAACYVPVRRAMRVDPVLALRYE